MRNRPQSQVRFSLIADVSLLSVRLVPKADMTAATTIYIFMNK